MSPPLLIVCATGDPAGIGPEVSLAACAALGDAAASVLLVGDAAWLSEVAGSLGLGPPVEVGGVAEARERAAAGGPPSVLSIPGAGGAPVPGRPRTIDGRTALDALLAAARLAEAGEVDALVTAPVNKDLVARHAPDFRGHTELLARRAGVARPVMTFVGPRPAVALLTTHLPLAVAVVAVRRRPIVDVLVALDAGWSRCFGRRPRIAVAGLNPHAGEGGRLGTEEDREVLPAVVEARAAGIAATGPHPADSVFRNTDADVVLALYHDQGTLMAKRAPGVSVNLTLGLPYPRTSPDHGVAYDIAGRGVAEPAAMHAALELALELAGNAARGPSS